MNKIKLKQLFLIVFLLVGLILPVAIFAQSSSTVKTKVGNPVVIATSCPIPNGNQNCGSQSTLSPNNCGHCTPEYIASDTKPPQLLDMCSDPNYPAIHYALDIGANALDPFYLPDVNGKRIKWFHDNQFKDADGITAIHYYSGTDEQTGDQYWIQFHHAKPDVFTQVGYSGDLGGQICQTGCKTGSGSHLHIEFARKESNGSKTWLDAPNYFCKK